MNPFLWRGPQFLLFYLTLCAIVLVWCWWRSRGNGEGQKPPLINLLNDPYRIAYLRGGESEAVTAATFNLLDRGFLRSEGRMLIRVRPDAERLLKQSLDRAIVAACGTSQTLQALTKLSGVRGACDAYLRELEHGCFLFDADGRQVQRLRWIGALAVLGGAAFIKLYVAVTNGHFNVGGLILLAAISCIAVTSLCRERLTPVGRSAVSALQSLTRRLRDNTASLRPGGGNGDALLVVCVWGVFCLAGPLFPFIVQVFPAPQTSPSTSSSGDTSSSSCGSSCGGSCGGCGGCGS